MEYRIISESNANALNNEVNRLIDLGWRLGPSPLIVTATVGSSIPSSQHGQLVIECRYVRELLKD